MAGKPELSVAQQTQQAPGVQNVVVYVSNENIAQAYASAVGGHHHHQHLEIPHQNGLVYGGGNNSSHHHVATKNYKQTPIKGGDSSEVVRGVVPSNSGGVLDVGAGGGCFYQNTSIHASAAPPAQQQTNGFLTQFNHHNTNQNSGAVITPSNFGGGATTLKNVIGFNSGTGEVYATTSTNVRSSDIVKRDDVVSVASSSYVATTGDGTGAPAFVTVMGTDVARDVTSAGGARCDSVRSETAESSCSSLSSADSNDLGRTRGLVLLSTTTQQHTTPDVVSHLQPQSTPVATQPPNSDVAVVYEANGISIGSTCGQQPLVLAMAPPGTVFQQQAQPFPVIVPLGWKRIINNNVVIYISYEREQLQDSLISAIGTN